MRYWSKNSETTKGKKPKSREMLRWPPPVRRKETCGLVISWEISLLMSKLEEKLPIMRLL